MTRLLAILLLMLPAASRAGITFVGTATGGRVTAAACTPGNAAASAIAYDIAVVVLHSRTNTAHTCTTNCSSVGLGSSSWTILGAQGGATQGGRLSVWWLRLAGNLATAPTFGGPATESYTCQMFLFRGVTHVNPPYSTWTQSTNSSSTTFTGSVSINTSTLGWMAVFVGGSMTSSSWSTPGGTYNDAVGGFTSNTNGTDNSVFLSYDSTPDPTLVTALTAPTLVQSVAAAGRSQVFAWIPTPSTGGMNGFFP